MRTLRLLLWLRWKLFLRSTSTGNRVVGALVTVLLLLAFSPAWFGGAMLAFAGVRANGATTLPVVFGVCQLAWLSLGILSGALGRSFDLDKFLRYPVRPRLVFAINVAASLLGPVPLMIVPSLVAVTIAAGLRAGLAGALGTGLAGLFVLLVTAALLQVLLAVLDEVLRKESTRFVATLFMTAVFVGLQFGTRWAARLLAENSVLRFAHHQISGREAIAIMADWLGRFPTVGAPTLLAGGAIEGAPLRAALGALACAAMLALAVLPGAALMRRTVRAGEGGGGPARRSGAEGRGSFAVPGLPRGVGLVFRYEILTTLRQPQRLMSIVVAPLVGVVFFMNGHGRFNLGTAFVLVMLATSVSSASLLSFAYDGPGVRSFFLLPVEPRALLLAKNLEICQRLVIQFVLAFAALGFLVHGIWTPLTLTALLADVAVVLAALALGTTVSMRHPVRARRRGLSGRGGGGGWQVQVFGVGIYVGAAAIAALIWGVRVLAGRTWADAAGLLVAVLLLAAGAAIWWRSLDLNARVLLECRERMIEVLARTEAD